jgi:hypothetical protein
MVLRRSIYFFRALPLLFLTACSTMHLPNTGFEDTLPIKSRQAKVTLGPGNTQSLNFNDFENREDKNSISYGNVGSLILSGATGLTKNLDVSVSSYSIIPFPSMIGFKYQFYDADDAQGIFSASATIKYGYSVFGNQGGYSPIGGTCGDNGENCSEDPNGRWVSGNASAYILGFPIGYQFSEDMRIILNPQITYFDGRYTLHKKISATENQETTYGLSGLRKTIALNGLYQFTKAWDTQLSFQFHDYSWNGIKSSQGISVYVGISYLVGGG